MKFEITREWLAEKLAHCDDTSVGAGGTSLEKFKKEIEQRTVTPSVLKNVPTELGRAIRYVREQKGWTRSELAELADIDEAEITAVETDAEFDPKPRTVTQLADACHFSRERFIQLAKHRQVAAANECSNGFVLGIRNHICSLRFSGKPNRALVSSRYLAVFC